MTDAAPLASKNRLATDVMAILALVLLNLGTAVGYAALIFAGPLASGLPRAASAFLLGSAIVTIVVALRGNLTMAFASTQDAPVVIMAAVATAMIAKNAGTDPTAVVVMIGLASALTGIGMIVVGRFGFGRIVRYLPTTVVSAFIAGTGWLLFKGGFDIMVSRNLGLRELDGVFGSGQLKFWLPGLLIGIAILVSGRITSMPPLTGSIVALVGTAGFFAVGLAVSSLSILQDDGWLVGPFPDGVDLRLISSSEISALSWATVGQNVPGLLTAVAVSLMAVLLNLTSLEAIDGSSVDVDHEIATAGVANLLIAPIGGMVGFQAISDTVLARQMGMTNRVVPIGTGLLIGLAAAFGGEAIGYLPRVIAGAMLVAVGLGLLVRWVEEMFATVDWLRRVFSIGIVLVIGFVGILEGVAAGTIAAIVLFVVQYSQIDPVRVASTGTDVRSHVDWSPAEEARLGDVGESLSVVQLQGFLFFGSLGQLADRIRTRSDQDNPPLVVVVLDFKHVTGVDWSGYSLLSRMGEQVASSGASMLVSGLSPQIETALRRSEATFLEQTKTFATLEVALETAERSLLDGWSGGGAGSTKTPVPLSDELRSCFEASEFEPGSVVMEQGSPSDELHIVESGTLSAYMIEPGGARQRLRQFGAGAFVGEIGMVTGNERSAEVVADTDAELLTLSRQAFSQLRSEQPELALELQDHILVEQSERVVSLSKNLTRALR